MMQVSVFSSYNHTQLQQTCAKAGVVVRPNETREAMISYLEGTDAPPVLEECDNVFHTWRYGLIRFLTEYWRQIETQITCPARALKDTTNPNPRPCFGCLDTKVIDCLVENNHQLRLIETYRLLRRPQ